MNLTADQLASLVRCLAVNPDSVCTEKRRAARVGHHGWIEITHCERTGSKGRGDGAAQPNSGPAERTRAQVANISLRGIALISGTPMQAGQQFLVHLRHQNGHQTSVLCTVVHCMEKPGNVFGIGAEFTCVVSADAACQPSQDEEQASRIRQSILG